MTKYRIIYEAFIEADDLWDALDKCDRIDGLELIAVGEDRFRMDEIFVDIAKG